MQIPVKELARRPILQHAWTGHDDGGAAIIKFVQGREILNMPELKRVFDVVEVPNAIVHLVDVRLIRRNAPLRHSRQADDWKALEFWMFAPIFIEQQ